MHGLVTQPLIPPVHLKFFGGDNVHTVVRVLPAGETVKKLRELRPTSTSRNAKIATQPTHTPIMFTFTFSCSQEEEGGIHVKRFIFFYSQGGRGRRQAAASVLACSSAGPNFRARGLAFACV